MITSYLAAMRRYADFAGRTSRSDYWWFKLSLFALLLVAAFVDGMTSGDRDFDDAGLPIVGLVLVAHLVPGLAAGVRRLHDTDRSGWLLLIGLIPLVGPIVLVVWFCQTGTSGANQFGPDPLASLADAPVRGGRPITATARDVVAEVERLAGLRASGALTEAEFTTLKAQVVTAGASA